MRFYDKAAQMGTSLPWTRAEIELKGIRAQKAIVLIVVDVSVGELFVGILSECSHYV
jgi:DNA relaxase NicK